MTKVTLIDVGREAGVSAITVSRALRSPEKVSDSLRAKVEAAVRKLGYVPNQSASALASSETNSIVVMIPSMSNHVFTDVLRGIEDALKDTRITLQIGNTGYDPLEEERILRSFLNPAPKGVILAGIEQTDETRSMLANIGVPVVQIMDLSDAPIGKIVGFSHEKAAMSAVQHLLDQGYQKIGFLGAQMDPRSQKRLAGFKRTLQNADLLDEQAIVVTNRPSDVRTGSNLYGKLMQQYPECDAIFCNNDDMALGVLFECQRRGINIPRDFGLCGFNDLGVTAECVPTISTVQTPLFEIGQTAGTILLKGLEQYPEDTIDLGFAVAPRESSRK
ncbi:LacI family DNA-binding transcriptional regulator [Cohaesibacter gelatinilyticus]|uniref:Transcriptional regulator, LacI family n=1 Tax=Cohaesibacter gelatinilyticus TaxID=372072 RepID=A0A285PDT2_9HYPH|nr:LacI family DNA-binding transcriptional regulator [Cohaesibacter gelatinilyticus]SNZ19608.1 transcriptional regulator, LacI family [Cohaesibacter gelatinilyticus]